jgi:hypothetical protein
VRSAHTRADPQRSASLRDVGDDAPRRDAANAPFRLSSTGDGRSLWDTVHARDGSGPADDAPDEECHRHGPEDQGRRDDKRCTDEPEHVDQHGARDGISNRPATSSAAAVRSCPVMAITCICEPALAAITWPTRRIRNAGIASVYSYAGQTVRLRRCEQDHHPEKRDHEGDAESAMP